MNQQKHFILVHGACHGAWYWYKVKPLLESAGHKVTVLDLAAAGISTKKIEDVRTFNDYSAPLLETVASIPPGEKVILVGHSYGGLSIALAMENFPEKVSLGVFLTAFLPDTIKKVSYVLDQWFETLKEGKLMDTKHESYGPPDQPLTSVIFGPKFVESKLYHLSPVEDVTLGITLLRPVSLFREEFAPANYLTVERYGSVPRAYVVCDQDQVITEGFQRWMISNAGVNTVKEIKGADHMPMFSKPQELCATLLEVANEYA